MTQLLGRIIAAGPLRQLPARTRWQMHASLRCLYAEAGRNGSLALLPPPPEFRPCPEAGLAAAGAGPALRELVNSGLLRRQGRLAAATLEVDDAMLVAWRRDLMSCDPLLVEMLQRSGERWAAFCPSAANIRESPVRSPDLSVTSSSA